MFNYKKLGILTLVAIFVATFALAGYSQKEYEDVTLTVVTESGYQRNSAVMAKKVWEEEYGGKIEIVTFPFGELYQKIMTTFTMGQAQFDVLIFPSGWMGDFAGGGYLEPLDKYLTEDEEFNMSEVMPIFRDRIIKWAGKTYSLPYDGDLHNIVVRTDLINNPEYKEQFREEYGYELGVPETWEEYRDIAEFADGWDWDGDGEDEHGAAEAMQKGTQSYWMFLSRAAPYMAMPGQPGFMFDPETMEPLVNKPGFVKALEAYKEIQNYGLPGALNVNVSDVRDAFAAGEAALAIDWGDTAINAATLEGSEVQGKYQAAMTPGTKKVWNRKTGEWYEFEKFPSVNHAPFLAFGGWTAGITKHSSKKEAAYSYISLLCGPEHSLKAVTTAQSGRQPYRQSHFASVDEWTKFGFTDPDKEYLNAVQRSLSYPNSRPDLRIPGLQRYYDALDAQITRALTGELSPQKALDNVAERWEQITDDLGRERQLKLYRQSLGLEAQE